MSSRRCFLKVLGASALGTSGLSGCGGGGGEDPPIAPAPCTVTTGDTTGMLATGIQASALVLGELMPLADEQLYLGRDEGGIWAMTSRCQHAGCDLRDFDQPPGELHCECHGSEFTENGEVLMGPAEATLEHYAIVIDPSGEIYINQLQFAPADERVPVC